MRQGRRVGGPVLVTHAVLLTPEDPTRFGYVVSKKVGNAVTRNTVTRRLKAISDELLREGCMGADVVFRAQPASAHTDFHALKAEVQRHLHKLGIASFKETP